jgi:hypothetical protein
MPFQGSLERFCRPCPVGVLGFPLVAELAHGPLLAVRDEDRIEAEPARAAGLVRDPALQHPRAAELLAGGRERDKLADVSRSPALAFDSLELTQQPRNGLAASEPRRFDPGPAAEPGDLEAGVLAEDPRRRLERPPVGGLGLGVLVIRGTFLGRVVVGLERLQVPAQGPTQLAELPRIP